MPGEPPSRAELVEVLRNQLFEEIRYQADQMASLCRSLGEAAYRGSEDLTALHIGELRKVLLTLIAARNDLHRAQLPRGEGVAGTGAEARRGDGKRTGNDDGRGRSK